MEKKVETKEEKPTVKEKPVEKKVEEKPKQVKVKPKPAPKIEEPVPEKKVEKPIAKEKKVEKDYMRKALNKGCSILQEQNLVGLFKKNREFAEFLTTYLRGEEEFL